MVGIQLCVFLIASFLIFSGYESGRKHKKKASQGCCLLPADP